MTRLFTTNDDVVLEGADLAPLARSNSSGLRKATEVSELSSSGNFSEGCTITLGNDGEFASIVTDPAPAARSLAHFRSEISVGQEVVEVNLI